jgi:hypothetical protein
MNSPGIGGYPGIGYRSIGESEILDSQPNIESNTSKGYEAESSNKKVPVPVPNEMPKTAIKS